MLMFRYLDVFACVYGVKQLTFVLLLLLPPPPPLLVLFLMLLLLLLYLSPLCRVFTILYLAETMFLGYEVLQLFRIYSLCYIYCYFVHEMCFVLLH